VIRTGEQIFGHSERTDGAGCAGRSGCERLEIGGPRSEVRGRRCGIYPIPKPRMTWKPTSMDIGSPATRRLPRLRRTNLDGTSSSRGPFGKGRRHALSRGRRRASRRGCDLDAQLALERLADELLDAQLDTLLLARALVGDLSWRAHLDYLRDLQRVGHETLALELPAGDGVAPADR
jgi:hypothetical protein